MKVNLTAATEYISKQQLVRMTVASNGGYGDQVACLHAIGWLRSLGFNGRVEIIHNGIIYKLVRLLGIEDSFHYGEIYQLTEENITFIKRETFFENYNQFEIADLYIVPTESASAVYSRASPYPQERLFKAKYAVTFNHYPAYEEKQAIHFPVPTLRDAVRFLDDPHKRFLLTRKPGLPYLLTLIHEKSINPWSIYGLSTEFESVNVSASVKFLGKIAEELSQEKIMRKGPILLLLHNELSRADLSSLNHFSLIDLRDPEFELKVNQLNDKQVAAVYLGTLPMVVFEAIVRESLFPTFLEGANLETMMLELNRPSYLQGDGDVTYLKRFIDNYNKSLPEYNHLRQIVYDSGAIFGSDGMPSASVEKSVKKFIKESFDPKSPLCDMLTLINKEYHAFGNDRYLQKIAARLSSPMQSIFSDSVPSELQQKILRKHSGSCDKSGISLLLSFDSVDKVSECLAKSDLASQAKSVMRRGENDEPIFFYLMYRSDADFEIRRVKMQYLEKNPQLCTALSTSESCIRHLRDASFVGGAEGVKETVEFCRPKLKEIPNLQDAISEFCQAQETLYPQFLSSAQRQVHQLMMALLAPSSLMATHRSASRQSDNLPESFFILFCLLVAIGLLIKSLIRTISPSMNSRLRLFSPARINGEYKTGQDLKRGALTVDGSTPFKWAI